jgi:hypothetical protein
MFDVSPDGKWFVMVKSDPIASLRTVNLVLNWFAASTVTKPDIARAMQAASVAVRVMRLPQHRDLSIASGHQSPALHGRAPRRVVRRARVRTGVNSCSFETHEMLRFVRFWSIRTRRTPVRVPRRAHAHVLVMRAARSRELRRRGAILRSSGSADDAEVLAGVGPDRTPRELAITWPIEEQKALEAHADQRGR